MAELIGNFNRLKELAGKTALNTANAGCAEINVIIKFVELRKAQSELLSPASIVKLILEGLAGAAGMSSFLSNDSLLPSDVPFASVIASAANMLVDKAVDETTGKAKFAISGNLQHIWGAVSKEAHEDVIAKIEVMQDDLKNLKIAIENIPVVAVNEPGIDNAKRALKAFLNLPVENQTDATAIKDDVEQICNAYGIASRALFQALDAAAAFRASVQDLSDILQTPADILSSSGNIMRDRANVSQSSFNLAFKNSGVEDLQLFLSQINGVSNIDVRGPNSSDPLGELSVIRGACELIDNFYNGSDTGGQGAINWNQVFTDFGDALALDGMADLSSRAGDFAAIEVSKITDPINAAIDEAIVAAFQNGGSQEISNTMASKIGTQLGQALTAAATVATVYATSKKATDAFLKSISIMHDLNGSSAVKTLLSGNILDFFSQNKASLLGLTLEIAGLRECSKKSNNALSAALIEKMILDLINKSSTQGHGKVGVGDGAREFTKAALLTQLQLSRVNRLIR